MQVVPGDKFKLTHARQYVDAVTGAVTDVRHEVVHEEEITRAQTLTHWAYLDFGSGHAYFIGEDNLVEFLAGRFSDCEITVLPAWKPIRVEPGPPELW